MPSIESGSNLPLAWRLLCADPAKKLQARAALDEAADDVDDLLDLQTEYNDDSDYEWKNPWASVSASTSASVELVPVMVVRVPVVPVDDYACSLVQASLDPQGSSTSEEAIVDEKSLAKLRKKLREITRNHLKVTMKCWAGRTSPDLRPNSLTCWVGE